MIKAETNMSSTCNRAIIVTFGLLNGDTKQATFLAPLPCHDRLMLG